MPPQSNRTTEHGSRNTAKLLTALFLLALAPRLLLALSLPADDTVFVDQPYLEYARNFWAGEGFWSNAPYPGIPPERVYAFRPPLFPFLMGLAYGLTRGAYAPVRVAHAVISSLAILLAYAAGRELFRDRRVAFLGAAMAALYPPLVWHSVHLMTEPLFFFFLLLSIWALLRSAREEGVRWALVAGLATGLGTLTRSVLIGFAPLGGAWLWFVRGRSRRAALAAVLMWAATGLALAPWVIRNAKVFNRLVLTTTDFGHGFYVANNPKSLADPRGFYVPESWDFVLESPDEQPDELEVRSRLTRMTRDFIRQNKGMYARLVLSRAWTFWRPWPNPDFVPRSHVVIYGASFISAFLLMVPGFVLAWRTGERRGGHTLVLLLTAYMTGVHALVLAMLRYRVPLMPLLLMYAAYAVFRWADSMRNRGGGFQTRPYGPRETFDEIAGEYDRSLPEHVQEHYAAKRARLLNSFSPQRGLDVGCGTGWLLERVDCAEMCFGADASGGMLRQLLAEGRGEAVRADAGLLPWPDGAFDLVWCVATLHHLAEVEKVAAAVGEMIRVARSGGHVVIWDHNPSNPYWPLLMARVPQDSGAERLIPAKEIAAALEKAGVKEWRLTRSGWVPDFAPRWAMPLFRGFETLAERTPLVKNLSAHNVFVVCP